MIILVLLQKSRGYRSWVYSTSPTSAKQVSCVIYASMTYAGVTFTSVTFTSVTYVTNIYYKLHVTSDTST